MRAESLSDLPPAQGIIRMPGKKQNFFKLDRKKSTQETIKRRGRSCVQKTRLVS